MREWHLKHHWWPFRGKTVKERGENISDAALHMAQRLLFEESSWAALARQTGRKFGVPELRAKLVKLFDQLVQRAWVPFVS